LPRSFFQRSNDDLIIMVVVWSFSSVVSIVTSKKRAEFRQKESGAGAKALQNRGFAPGKKMPESLAKRGKERPSRS
jgi:hypothetical protein